MNAPLRTAIYGLAALGAVVVLAAAALVASPAHAVTPPAAWNPNQGVLNACYDHTGALTDCNGGAEGGNAAASATGSAVPADAGFTGLSNGGTLVGWKGNAAGDGFVLLDATILPPPSAGTSSLVCNATASMTGTTQTSLCAAPGAGLHNYITSILCGNASATVGTLVDVEDGSAGTVLMAIPAAISYGGGAITLPTPLRQPTANTALFVVNETTGAAVKCSAVGWTGA